MLVVVLGASIVEREGWMSFIPGRSNPLRNFTTKWRGEREGDRRKKKMDNQRRNYGIGLNSGPSGRVERCLEW